MREAIAFNNRCLNIHRFVNDSQKLFATMVVKRCTITLCHFRKYYEKSSRQ